MSASEDITNLFRKFGGDPEHYQEMSRENAAQESKARWPLLSSVHLSGNVFAPSVKEGMEPMSSAPVPNLQGHTLVQTTVSPFAAQVASALSAEAQASVAADAAAGSLAHSVSHTSSVGSVGNTLFKTRAAVRAERRSDAARATPHARHATGVGGLGGQGDSRRGGIQTNRLAAQVSSAPDAALRFEPHLRDDEREHGVPPLAYPAHDARDLDGEPLLPNHRPATLGQTMRRFAKEDGGHAGAPRSAPDERPPVRPSMSPSLTRSIRRTPDKATSETITQARSQALVTSRSLHALRVTSSSAARVRQDGEVEQKAEQTAEQTHDTHVPDAARERSATAPRSLSSVFSRLASPSPEATPVADASPTTAPVSRNPLFARLSRL